MKLTAEFRAKVLAKVLGTESIWAPMVGLSDNDYRCALEDALLAKGYHDIHYFGKTPHIGCYVDTSRATADNLTDALTLAAARAHNMEVPDAK